jgi:hypothetical protein
LPAKITFAFHHKHVQTLQQLKRGELAGSKRVKLACGLTAFPLEILELSETLEILDLSGNQLSSLPDDFVRLKNLRILFLSDNQFTTWPVVLSKCINLTMVGFKANRIATIAEDALPVNLRWLILTNNQLESLPLSIGKCKQLQKVMLAGNRLSQLPDTMRACKNIELLRISANRFEKIPSWLLALPRLSWLALSGNAFNQNQHYNNNLPEIAWNEFVIEEQLGEGASGTIFKAKWLSKEMEVAVKVFKGEVTSDGLPHDEMNACITAGTHPNLVSALGKIKDHPQSKDGLIFKLIPSHYKNLGGSPSFETCTRDTFAEGTVFSVHQIMSIISGIASAALHLHARALMHGDLYAHNILIDEQAHALFGDFGAATHYQLNDEHAPAFERIEVRAFGCLLDDLLTHVDVKDSQPVHSLQQLRDDCMQPNVMMRPSFSAICNRLNQPEANKSVV